MSSKRLTPIFCAKSNNLLNGEIGLRYSNEFYFVAPAGLLDASEIPIECGLIEVGSFAQGDRQSAFIPMGGFIHFDVNHRSCCRITVPAPWRDTPGPTWHFVAGMLRNQQKSFRGTPATPPNQQRLPFVD
jgi:hypothetical protein